MCGEDGPEDHGGTAPGTAPGRGGCGRGVGRRLGEQRAREGEPGGATAAGEIAELPDADEASWEEVLHDAPQKLGRGERHRALLRAVRVVLPAKRYALAVEGQQAVIADRTRCVYRPR